MRSPPIRCYLLSLLVGVGLLACGKGRESPATPAVATAAAGYQDAVSRVGDVTIRASVIQTSALAQSVAAQYGITRDDRTVLLLVAVRQGTEAQETALPARITATVTDLRGRRQDIAMRELRSGELLDYVGTVEVTLPDTLRFDLTIVREGGASSTMQFNREFYPR
ncbi:DUF4426 domain-containing protein [Lysobacter koreensis]|uniref:DUF4426 domain-containing protein n=1 Tax=Lysobacter koreensis TaxID=266122 RepID=A0ABW2YS77_9GAMM